MRRLAQPLLPILLICALAIVPTACKRKRRHAPVAESDQGMLATMVSAADPHAEAQFVKGFYPVENGAWRWTSRQFTMILRPPKLASQKGARLVLKFAIPGLEMEKLHSMTLSAMLNGAAIEPQEYTKPGDVSYVRDVPASALAGEAVKVEFTLDKYLSPSATDQRELGVIVNAAGFEAK